MPITWQGWSRYHFETIPHSLWSFSKPQLVPRLLWIWKKCRFDLIFPQSTENLPIKTHQLGSKVRPLYNFKLLLFSFVCIGSLQAQAYSVVVFKQALNQSLWLSIMTVYVFYPAYQIVIICMALFETTSSAPDCSSPAVVWQYCACFAHALTWLQTREREAESKAEAVDS